MTIVSLSRTFPLLAAMSLRGVAICWLDGGGSGGRCSREGTLCVGWPKHHYWQLLTIRYADQDQWWEVDVETTGKSALGMTVAWRGRYNDMATQRGGQFSRRQVQVSLMQVRDIWVASSSRHVRKRCTATSIYHVAVNVAPHRRRDDDVSKHSSTPRRRTAGGSRVRDGGRGVRARGTGCGRCGTTRGCRRTRRSRQGMRSSSVGDKVAVGGRCAWSDGI